MNVTYEHKPAMTLIGFSTAIRPEEGYQKCPEFWDKAYNQKYARLWQTMTPETAVEKAILDNGIGLFAICNQQGDAFEYWIAGLYQGGEVPEGLELFSFPERDWGGVLRKGSPARFPANPEHPGLAGVVSRARARSIRATEPSCWRSTPPAICRAPITSAASGCRSAHRSNGAVNHGLRLEKPAAVRCKGIQRRQEHPQGRSCLAFLKWRLFVLLPLALVGLPPGGEVGILGGESGLDTFKRQKSRISFTVKNRH